MPERIKEGIENFEQRSKRASFVGTSEVSLKELVFIACRPTRPQGSNCR